MPEREKHPRGGGSRHTIRQGSLTALTQIDAGVVAMWRGVIETLPKGSSALERDLYPVLAEEERLLACPIAQRFYDAGTAARLDELERVLRA